MILRIGSLFSGIGGLELGVTAALGELGVRSEVVWQAEREAYPRAVLARHWPQVPCYEDVRDVDFQTPGCDLLCGGFPCQDTSHAGKRAGLDGTESGQWSEFERAIRLLRPGFVFVENVPGLLAELGRVLEPLAALGFDAQWDLFSAAEVGAPHLRERVFILAYAARLGRQVGLGGGPRPQHAAAPRSRGARGLAHADGDRRQVPGRARKGAEVPSAARGGLAVPHAGHQQRQQQPVALAGRRGATLPRGDGTEWAVAHAHGRRFPRGESAQGSALAWFRGRPQARTEPARPDPWEVEPRVGRVVDGSRTRLDGGRRRARLRCLGNSVVRQQASRAFLTLLRRALAAEGGA